MCAIRLYGTVYVWSCWKTRVAVACVVVMVVSRHLLTTAQTSASRHMPLLHFNISGNCLTFIQMTTWFVFTLLDYITRTAYIDVLYYYRPCSMVCWSVSLSVCLSVILVSPAETATIWLRTRVGPGNHVLDGSPDRPMGRSNLSRKGRPFVKYRGTLQSSVQKWLNRSRCRLGLGLWLAQGTMY